MTYKFTKSSEKSIEIANELAIELGHSYVGTEHLLYGLAKEGTGIANKVLENQNIISDAIKEKTEELVGISKDGTVATLGLTPRTKKVIENAFKESKKLGSNYIGTEHLLIGIMREGDSIAARIMIDLKVSHQKLYNDIVKTINEYETGDGTNSSKISKRDIGSYNMTTTLNQFGNDLTKEVIARQIRPCYWKKRRNRKNYTNLI